MILSIDETVRNPRSKQAGDDEQGVRLGEGGQMYKGGKKVNPMSAAMGGRGMAGMGGPRAMGMGGRGGRGRVPRGR